MITARQLDTLNNNKHTTNACSKQPSALKLLTKQCNITFTYITFINIINYELSTSLKPGGNFFYPSVCFHAWILNSKRYSNFLWQPFLAVFFLQNFLIFIVYLVMWGKTFTSQLMLHFAAVTILKSCSMVTISKFLCFIWYSSS